MHVARELRHSQPRHRREAPVDLVEIYALLRLAGDQERVGAGLRQHAVDDEGADAHAGLVELGQRPGGFLDRQPLGDEHEDERRDARADQPGAKLAQPFEPIGERHA